MHSAALNYNSEPEKALKFIEASIRLDPLGPPNWEFHKGHANYLLGRKEEAITIIRHAATRGSGFPIPHLFLAVISIELGRPDEAAEELVRLLDKTPGYSISDTERIFPYRHAEDKSRFLDGLRKAGLPE